MPSADLRASMAHMVAASDALSAVGSALLGNMSFWLRSAIVQAQERLATQERTLQQLPPRELPPIAPLLTPTDHGAAAWAVQQLFLATSRRREGGHSARRLLLAVREAQHAGVDLSDLASESMAEPTDGIGIRRGARACWSASESSRRCT
jgi:hypothetical protein